MKNKKTLIFMTLIIIVFFINVLEIDYYKNDKTITLDDLLINNKLILFDRKFEIVKMFTDFNDYKYENIGTNSPDSKRMHETYTYDDIRISYITHEENSESGLAISYDITSNKYPIKDIMVGDDLKSITDRYPDFEVIDLTDNSEITNNILNITSRYTGLNSSNSMFTKAIFIPINYTNLDLIKYKDSLPPSIAITLLFSNDKLDIISVTCPSAE
ncbi:MAG: hypothetical protein AAGU76_15370 [Sedimentibacter sp.]|uniref:hypothetical protein n=1 Tax=Sedimentibacter sp. TaxID=1960295 RepID=UPI003158FE8A